MEYTNTVLIVDDSKMIIKVLSFIIKKAGYHLLSAEDGKSALAFLDGRNIDLVITDLNMPGMDGTMLINEIRINDYYRYTPVVLFMGDNEKDRKYIRETSGATITFDKANIKEKIIPAIKKILG